MVLGAQEKRHQSTGFSPKAQIKWELEVAHFSKQSLPLLKETQSHPGSRVNTSDHRLLFFFSFMSFASIQVVWNLGCYYYFGINKSLNCPHLRGVRRQTALPMLQCGLVWGVEPASPPKNRQVQKGRSGRVSSHDMLFLEHFTWRDLNAFTNDKPSGSIQVQLWGTNENIGLVYRCRWTFLSWQPVPK